VLNDLFGIQCRGGCSCAGPYGHGLLGIDSDRAHAYADQAVDGWLGIKPGWTRLSFSFYQSEQVFEYIVAAVHLVATYGVRLLPDYRFDPRSGRWSHRDAPAPLPGLADNAYGSDGLLHGPGRRPDRLPDTALTDHLAEARALLAARPVPRGGPVDTGPTLPEPLEALRWFELPSGCLVSGKDRGVT
jgi:hypothetical protein